MSAYIVFTRDSTHDHAELETYMAQVRSTMAGHPIKILAAYGPHEVLEGPAVEGMVIAEFPSVEAAKAWYHSPAYQEVVQHRFKGGAYRAVLVAGL